MLSAGTDDTLEAHTEGRNRPGILGAEKVRRVSAAGYDASS